MKTVLNIGRTNSASALIMVILTLALMVTVAVSFMNMVGRQKGTSIGVALQTHADIALQQAQAHTIRAFVESIEETKSLGGAEVHFTTGKNAQWRREFDAVIDADANHWTEDDRIYVSPNGQTLDPSTTTTSGHPMINTDIPLIDMVGHTGRDNRFTRWINHAYLTTELKPIEIDPSLTEAEKVKLRKSARYVVRYTSKVLDANGMICINHNFPEFLSSGESINRGSGAVDSLHYIRYQNYLKHYGRNFKSMIGGYRMHYASDGGAGQYRVQKRYDPNYTMEDPLDRETVGYGENGKSGSIFAYGTLNHDGRIALERAFRGGGLQFIGGGVALGSGHKGKVYTWGHISAALYGGGPSFMAPYGGSLQDADLVDPASSVPPQEVSTPWHVNLLSTDNYTLRAMIAGLSSEVRINTGRYVNTDLFGKGYPEPFPLEFDAGRNVLIVDTEHPYTGRNYDWRWVMPFGSGVNVYSNSYALDIAIALVNSILQAREAWINERSPSYHGLTNADTFIDINTTDNRSWEMMEQILRETYRIMGEHKVNGTGGSLLSGDKVSIRSGSSYFDIIPDVELHPDDNTRAMEFMLNDYMISLFGKSNPASGAYNVGDEVVDDAIAVDFNSDGVVESTITGWHDYDTDKRTWSWWWDGLGPYVKVSDENDYMKRPGWYRFVEGDVTATGKLTPYRKIGSEWVAVTDPVAFYDYNDLWLKAGTSYPIKPFAKTGRLFIGKSKVLYSFIRGEVYNIIEEKVSAAANRNFAYHIDPNDDRDYSDNTLLIQTEMKLVNE